MLKVDNQAATQPVLGTEPIRLHLNENPYPIPLRVAQKLQQASADLWLNRYPDQAAELFYQALSRQLQLPREMLLAGNGSDELIMLLLLAAGREGRVLLPSPSFSMYKRFADSLELLTTELPLKPDWQLDMPLILKTAGNAQGLIFVCRPNNPTGNLFPQSDVLRLLQETQLTVVVDEAYSEFCGDSLLKLLPTEPRLVILRTFSKAYGLAGIRLGYLAADPKIVQAIERVRSPYNLNTQSLTVGRIALEEADLLLRQVPLITAERDWLSTQLSALPGVCVFPSVTNFLLLRLPQAAEPIYAQLLQQGLLVRRLAELPDCLRVSVGLRAPNSQLVTALKRCLAQPEVS